MLCSLSHRTKIWREHSGSDVFGIHEHCFFFKIVIPYFIFLHSNLAGWLITHFSMVRQTQNTFNIDFLVLGTHRQRDLACIYVHFNRMFLVFDTSILLFRKKKTLTQFCRCTNVYITYGNPVSSHSGIRVMHLLIRKTLFNNTINMHYCS